MPDISLFKELSDILGITLNELFEGKKLKIEEINNLSEKNIISLIIARDKLENMQLLTEVLIFIGIVITITLTSLIADTTIQKIITLVTGTFVWGFGLFLRINVRVAINKLNIK